MLTIDNPDSIAWPGAMLMSAARVELLLQGWKLENLLYGILQKFSMAQGTYHYLSYVTSCAQFFCQYLGITSPAEFNAYGSGSWS